MGRRGRGALASALSHSPSACRRIHQRELQPGQPLPPNIHPGASASADLVEAEQQGESRVFSVGYGGLPEQGSAASEGGQAQDPGGNVFCLPWQRAVVVRC